MDPSLDAYTVLKDDDYKSPNIGLEDSQELLQKLGLSQVFVIDLLVSYLGFLDLERLCERDL